MGDNDYLWAVNLSFTAIVVNGQFPSALFFTPVFSQVLLKYKFYMNIYVLKPDFKMLLTDLVYKNKII